MYELWDRGAGMCIGQYPSEDGVRAAVQQLDDKGYRASAILRDLEVVYHPGWGSPRTLAGRGDVNAWADLLVTDEVLAATTFEKIPTTAAHRATFGRLSRRAGHQKLISMLILAVGFGAIAWLLMSLVGDWVASAVAGLLGGLAGYGIFKLVSAMTAPGQPSLRLSVARVSGPLAIRFVERHRDPYYMACIGRDRIRVDYDTAEALIWLGPRARVIAECAPVQNGLFEVRDPDGRLLFQHPNYEPGEQPDP